MPQCIIPLLNHEKNTTKNQNIGSKRFLELVEAGEILTVKNRNGTGEVGKTIFKTWKVHCMEPGEQHTGSLSYF